MRTIALAIVALLAGAALSSQIGGCCAATTEMPAGSYRAYDGAEPDYDFTLAADGTATERYSRNGKQYVVVYRNAID
jgi:hypothetical protein